MDVKKMKKNWDKETIELIEISREALRVSRKIREEREKQEEKKQPECPYEEALKINPYISKDKIIY